MTTLSIQMLRKRYVTKEALRGVTFSVEPGRVVGILGPNGSGKTTLLKLIAGLLTPTDGEVIVDGGTGRGRLHENVAYLPDAPSLYPWASVAGSAEQHRRLFADFDPGAFEDMRASLGLEPSAKVGSLSKGGVEQLGLALTLSRRALITVLDEPLLGVDMHAREELLRGIVRGLRPDAIVLITSHLISDLEPLLDDVIMLRDGEIVLSGDAEELRATYGLTVENIYRQELAS